MEDADSDEAGSGPGTKYLAVVAGVALILARLVNLLQGIVDPERNSHVVFQELLAVAAVAALAWFGVGLVRIAQGRRFNEGHLLALLVSLPLYWMWDAVASADDL